jgi:phytoene dehydrogenase-like protein
VVSNADIKRTYLELVGRQHLSPRTVARVERYRMALPLFCVYLGLDIDLSDRMPNTQYWSFPSYDVEGIYRSAYGAEPTAELAVYITSASVKDPYTAHIAPPGHSALELMAIVPPDYDYWNVADGPAAGEKYSRKPDYRAAKDQLTEALIKRASQLIEGLEEHIVWKEAATPITQERYTLSSGGSCYGLELATDQFGPRRPGPTTEIDGLYLAGASTVWCHGIVGAMTGGVGTAGAILGRDLHAEIRAGRVFADTTRLTAGGPGWDPLLASRRLSHKPRRRSRDKEPAAA